MSRKELTFHSKMGGKETPVCLSASPVEGDPEGQSSRFEGSHEQLAQQVGDEEEGLEGKLEVTIDGKSYTGTISHEDHEHDHGREHGEQEDHEGDHEHEHEKEKSS